MRIYSVIEMVSKPHRLVVQLYKGAFPYHFYFVLKPHCLVVQLYEGAFPYHFYFVLLPLVWAFLAYCMARTHQTPGQQQHLTLKPPSLFAT